MSQQAFALAQAEICFAMLADMKFNDKPIAIRNLIDEQGLYVDAFPSKLSKDFYAAVLRVYLRATPKGENVRFPEVMMELEAGGSRDLHLWQAWFSSTEKKRYAYEKAAQNLKSQFLRNITIKETEEWLKHIKQLDFSVNMNSEIAGFVNLLTNLAMDGTQDANPANAIRRAWKLGVREPEPTGFDALNRDWNGGWRPSNLVVVGMPSGAGKTSASCSFVVERIRQGRYSLYNSYEQTIDELSIIMLSNLANMPYDQVEKGYCSSAEEEQSLSDAVELLGKYVRIYDAACRLEELPVRVRRHQAEFGPKLDWMVAEPLGIVNSDSRASSSAEWSRDMENTAYFVKNNVSKPYSVCSVLFSQVPDSVRKQLEKTNDSLDDGLRGSTGVKNACDVYAIGARHNGFLKGAKDFDREYYNSTFFKTTKVRRTGNRSGYSVLKFDSVHHRLLNETLPAEY